MGHNGRVNFSALLLLRSTEKNPKTFTSILVFSSFYFTPTFVQWRERERDRFIRKVLQCSQKNVSPPQSSVDMSDTLEKTLKLKHYRHKVPRPLEPQFAENKGFRYGGVAGGWVEWGGWGESWLHFSLFWGTGLSAVTCDMPFVFNLSAHCHSSKNITFLKPVNTWTCEGMPIFVPFFFCCCTLPCAIPRSQIQPFLI